MILIPGAIAVQGLGYSPLLVALQGLVLTADTSSPRSVFMIVNVGSLMIRR